MSGHYDPVTNTTLPEMMNQGYPMYDSHYNPYSRVAGPPSHYDGVAFWYRPDNNDSIYDSDPSLYNQGLPMPGANMEAAGIKHRRTRSGCYTCRSRRVKCDETRPICARCKKGHRECEFPQSTTTSKRSKQSEPKSPVEAAIQEMKDSKSVKLETVNDESDTERKSSTSARRRTLSNSRTHSSQSAPRRQKHQSFQDVSPPLREKASPQSSTSSSSRSRGETPASSFHVSARSAEIQARQAKIKTLEPAMQKYLQFQRDHMTHYHYFFKLDPTDFVHNEFIDQALSFEPLLYAAVGFSAYHYELRQPDAKLANFIYYYSRALVLLRRSISKSEHTTWTTAMLLTVLQLATIEEYLGDWVNLVGHHKAGFTMLTTIYKPISMMETDLGRRIFSWFSRLDLVAGLMSGSSTRLDRAWFEANFAWYAAAVDDDPDNDIDIEGKLAVIVATNRFLGFDMAALFAKLPRGEISISQFEVENAKLVDRLQDLKANIEKLNDAFYTVEDFPAAETDPYDPEVDIVDPYVPGGLFREPYWNLNFMWIDWYAITQMQKYQASLVFNQQQPPPPSPPPPPPPSSLSSTSQSPTSSTTTATAFPTNTTTTTNARIALLSELSDLSLQQCRIYESILRYPLAPEGSILGAHASLGLAIVFLNKDAKHTLWARRKLAGIERLGYVFPPKFRAQMAQLWGEGLRQQDGRERKGEGEGSVEEWWLPNGEGKLKILEEIRKVVNERHDNTAAATTTGRNSRDEGILKSEVKDVRDLKAIFAKLDLRTQQGSEAMGVNNGRTAVDETSPLSDGTQSVESTITTTTATATATTLVDNSPDSPTGIGWSSSGGGEMGMEMEMEMEMEMGDNDGQDEWGNMPFGHHQGQTSESVRDKGKGKEISFRASAGGEGEGGERDHDADRMSGIWW